MRKSYERKLSAENKAKVIELYQGGQTGISLAKMFSVDPSSVYALLKRRGIVRRKAAVIPKLHGKENDIISHYLSGESMSQIGLMHKVSHSTISRILRERDVPSRINGNFQGKESDILADYQRGLNINDVAKKYSIAPLTTIKVLKKCGVTQRSRSESIRKYPLDESFFDNIDSEGKAYFLGFLYADGYNGGSKYKNRVALSLQIGDEEIITKFRLLLKSNQPLYYEKREGGCVTLSIHNKRLSERLTELGCHNAKTFTITFPEWMPDSLIPHFIRGYNDGDGHIHFNGKGVTVGSLGADAFIYRLAEIVKRECKVHVSFRPHPKSAGITSWQVRGRDQVSMVLAWLYKDATVYLERKKRKAEAVLTPTYYLNKPNGSDCHLSTLNEGQVMEINGMLLAGMTNAQIKRKVNISLDAINDIRNGRTWHHLTGLNSRNNLSTGNPKGEKHGMATLTEEDILLVKQLIIEGESNIEIASRFKISKDMISKIRCGKNWAHITGFTFTPQGKAHKGETNVSSKLNIAKVLEIKELLLRGESGVYVAKKLGISKANVSSIKRGKTWSHVTGL